MPMKDIGAKIRPRAKTEEKQVLAEPFRQSRAVDVKRTDSALCDRSEVRTRPWGPELRIDTESWQENADPEVGVLLALCSDYRMIAIQGRPITSSATKKITPKIAPRRQ